MFPIGYLRLILNYTNHKKNKPMNKNFFASKINWAAIILALVSISDYVQTFNFTDMTTKSWFTFGTSILIIIFRTFFTEKKPVV